MRDFSGCNCQPRQFISSVRARKAGLQGRIEFGERGKFVGVKRNSGKPRVLA
jgi:hypothetical protein